MLVSFCSLTKR